MLKIQFVLDPNSEFEKYTMLVNNLIDTRSYCYNIKAPDVHVYDDEITKLLTNESIETLGKDLSRLSYYQKGESKYDQFHIRINCRDIDGIKAPSIITNIMIYWQRWAKAWSIEEYFDELRLCTEALGSDKIKFFEPNTIFGNNGGGIIYKVDSKSKKIANEVDYLLSVLKELSATANKQLVEKVNKDSLITYFDFPKQIQTACKQYLVYFTQFLADIGVEANTEIKEDANRTLFKVTPVNKDEALTKIQEALAVYLKAPGFQNMNEQTGANNDIAVMQWQANIFHLKSQLALNAAILQTKDATIEALQLSNYQYKQLLDEKEKDATEDVIPGVVAVEKVKGQGFVIDLPEIVRRMKRRFNKD